MWVRLWNCVSVLRRSLVVSEADALRIGSGISFSVKILCSLWYAETFTWWMELSSGSDVTGSATWWIRFMVRHGWCQWSRWVSGPRARARVRVRFLESCRGRVLVHLVWESFSKVRATVQLSHRITLRPGWHAWWCWGVRPQVCF